MSFKRPGPRLRSLVRVGVAIRWRDGWVGEVEGEVKASVGERWDSRVAMREVDGVAADDDDASAVILPEGSGGLKVGRDRGDGWVG